MASKETETHSPLKTRLTTRRHLLCLVKEQTETTACFLDSLLISGDNFSHLCPGGNIFEWTLSGVRVSLRICGMHVCTCWCSVVYRCMSGGVCTWRCWEMTSGVILHFIYQGRVFHLNPGLAASASLESQLALGILFLLPACWSYRWVTLLPGLYER